MVEMDSKPSKTTWIPKILKFDSYNPAFPKFLPDFDKNHDYSKRNRLIMENQ